MYVLLPLYIEQTAPFVATNVDLCAKRLARRVADARRQEAKVSLSVHILTS
jgi:hypothetical protein